MSITDTLTEGERRDFSEKRDRVLKRLKARARPAPSGDRLNGQEGMVDRIGDKPAARSILYFYSRGCSWANHGGPCLACGHYRVSSRGNTVGADDFASQCHEGLQQLSEDIRVLSLYNGGSFLSKDEVPLGALKYIFKAIRDRQNIERVIIESLPEFVTVEYLERLKRWLGHKELEIGVGVDAVSGDVRELCVNKGCALATQLKALRTIRDAGCLPLSYVLVKPPFLSEEEAVVEAVRSVDVLISEGFPRVSLEPVSLQPGSFATYLHSRRLFYVPSLWTVQEVVRQVTRCDVELRIGGWQYRPKPMETFVDTACSQACRVNAMRALDGLNGTGHADGLLALDCECRRSSRSRSEWNRGVVDTIRAFVGTWGERAGRSEYRWLPGSGPVSS